MICLDQCSFCYTIYLLKTHPHIKIYDGNKNKQAFNDILRMHFPADNISETKRILDLASDIEKLCLSAKNKIKSLLFLFRNQECEFVEKISFKMFGYKLCRVLNCENFQQEDQIGCFCLTHQSILDQLDFYFNKNCASLVFDFL